jgi:serine/threonine-protein kinase
MAGSRVAGYVIEEQIGAGGMAVVYRARDDVLGRLVAVKVLSPALAMDAEFRTRFLRESRAVAAVDEPHIVPVYGAGDADGILYIATRFVAGGDLSRLQRAMGGRLPPAQVAEFVAQIAGALDAAHAVGLVHRDVKPGNILVERIPGRPMHAYLSDFGLSKSTSAGATGLTDAGHFMGTPDYCAPEQITGAPIDGRADQYSLACVAFSLLAGMTPFSQGNSMSKLFAHVNSPAPALTSIRPDLPAAIDGVLAKGMAKSPAARYRSCAAFASALRTALGGGAQASRDGQQTVTVGGSHPSFPPAGSGTSPVAAAGTTGRGEGQRRNTARVVGGSAAAALVLAAGVIVGVTLSSQHASTSTSNSNGQRSSPTPPPASDNAHTGTVTLVASLAAPGNVPLTTGFFSTDGNYIAAAGTKADIYIFSAESRKRIQTVSVGRSGNAVPVAFSPDDNTLYAVDSSARKIYVVDLATGKTAHVYTLPAGLTLGYTYNSSVVTAASSAGAISEYELATGRLYAQLRNPGSGSMLGARSNVNGNYVLIDEANGVAYLVDAQSKKVVGTFHYPANTTSLPPEISPDGNTVYVPGDSAAPGKLWDRVTGTYITPNDAHWPTPGNGVTFAIDSKFALTSATSASETVDIWNIATRGHVITVTVPGGADEEILSVGPGASELLSTSALNLTTNAFSKLNILSVPG